MQNTAGISGWKSGLVLGSAGTVHTALLVIALAMPTIAGAADADAAFFGWSNATTTPARAPEPHPHHGATVLPFAASKSASYAHRVALQPAHEGTVTTALDAPGFNTTYLELEKNGDRFWIASKIHDVQVGTTVAFSPEHVVTMENFESKALSRTFSRIYFVPSLTVVE